MDGSLFRNCMFIVTIFMMVSNIFWICQFPVRCVPAPHSDIETAHSSECIFFIFFPIPVRPVIALLLHRSCASLVQPSIGEPWMLKQPEKNSHTNTSHPNRSLCAVRAQSIYFYNANSCSNCQTVSLSVLTHNNRSSWRLHDGQWQAGKINENSNARKAHGCDEPWQ